MINKVYIWNDIKLLNKKVDNNDVYKKLVEIKNVLGDKVEILNNIESQYKKIVNKLKNVVTIGTRPNLFLNKHSKKYNISSKRIISESGFADDCVLNIDKHIYKMKKINIVEDIIVSGTTMERILEDLYINNSKAEINVYFLIGYENSILKLKEKFTDLNIYCFNILKEKAVEESTCMFLSDILYEKLGRKTYIEHIRNLNLFDSNTDFFIMKIKEVRKYIKTKVGIVTITVGINYGNRLQNYALQEVLNKLGIEAITFENVYQEIKIKDKIKRYMTLKKKSKIFKLKLKRFNDFNNKYIKFGEKIKSYHVPRNLKEKYDYFICGSDQIWNPYFSGNTGTNFLTFAENQKRITYAPSFGTSDIPVDRKKEFKEYLEGINYLSCREKQGVDMIKELTGQEAKLVLDPTFLLSAEQWQQIAKEPKHFPKKEYIATYFLGNKEEEYKEYINSLAKRYNLEVFNIMDMDDMDKFSTDPAEFIYLIKNSKVVCTDSFHGTAFSIIFNKPYILFERKSNMENMNSRFDSLKNLLDLPDRRHSSVNEIFNIDYSSVNAKLESNKIESINYLKEAFNLWE